MILCLISNQNIPLINDDNKFIARSRFDIGHCPISSPDRIRNDLSVCFPQFL